MKVGRNEPCPCGSGKKYKKCCSPKFDIPTVKPNADHKVQNSNILQRKPKSYSANAFFMTGEVRSLSDEQLIDRFTELGIPLLKEQFRTDLMEHLDISKLSKAWREKYNQNLEDEEIDFIYVALEHLGQKWAEDIWDTDKFRKLISDLEWIDDSKEEQKLNIYRTFWEKLKTVYVIPHQYSSFEQLRDHYEWPDDPEWFISEYEMELGNAMIGKAESELQDLANERIELCTDVLKFLPNTDESNLLNYRKAIGETYGGMGDYLKADEYFQTLTDEHPKWVWGYIGWGSLYTFKDEHRDLEKATRIFNIGLDRCKEDRDVLLERLNDL
jgi:tetratricopeptide (TPR) repeat protein